MLDPLDPWLHVVLDRPRIAENVGAVARLGAVTGVAVHACGPFLFGPADKKMRRAGLDYWADARIHFHQDLFRCLALLERRPWIVEVGGERAPWEVSFAPGDVVVLGPEDGSVAGALLEDRERILTLPGRPGLRSLNVAQCAAVVVFEALRQRLP